MSDTPKQSEDLNAVRQSIAFRHGVRGLISPTTEAEKRAAYGYDIVDIYNSFTNEEREHTSLDILYALKFFPVGWKVLTDALDRKQASNMPQGEMIATLRMASPMAKGALRMNSQVAMQQILGLPKKPSDIEGYIATVLSEEAYTVTERDQWGYASGANDEQSYDTLRSAPLYSTTTARELNGENTHFMMFKHGRTGVMCKRFSFVEKPHCDGASGHGDSRSISKSFLRRLQLDETVAEILHIHARRLEMAQRVLSKLQGDQETHTQLLFAHVLSSLIQSIDPDTSNIHVTDVTGMSSVQALVQICNEYLQMQGKHPVSGATGKDVILKIKTDLAVDALYRDEEEPPTKADLFLKALYIIEMKRAFGSLKRSGIRQKSQLVSESLARSMRLLEVEGATRNILLSVLCDCCSLFVLVHFRKEKTAYLSHREIEPGRMICVLVWLHLKSREADFTLKSFEESGFVTLGGFFEDEVIASQKKRGLIDEKNSDCGDAGDTMHKPYGESGKRKAACQNSWGDEECLNFDAMDEQERELELQSELDTLSALRNYHHFGHKLPLTKGVLNELQKHSLGTDSSIY